MSATIYHGVPRGHRRRCFLRRRNLSDAYLAALTKRGIDLTKTYDRPGEAFLQQRVPPSLPLPHFHPSSLTFPSDSLSLSFSVPFSCSLFHISLLSSSSSLSPSPCPTCRHLSYREHFPCGAHEFIMKHRRPEFGDTSRFAIVNHSNGCVRIYDCVSSPGLSPGEDEEINRGATYLKRHKAR